MSWYNKAASLGDAYAMENLGRIYYSGQGVEKNCHEAVRWYQKAADLGYTRTMAKLSRMYHAGDCLETDYINAYAWAALAMNRSTTKEERDEYFTLSLHMAQEQDPNDFEKAKQLSQELSKKIRIYCE